MLDPTAFETEEDFRKAMLEEGLKQGWTPVIPPKDNTPAQSSIEDILVHYGKKGMKWGVRSSSSGSQSVTVKDKGKKLKTSGGAGRPAHPEALRAHRIGQIVKKSGIKAVSNEELQVYANRLQLEQNVSRLTNSNKSAGLKVSNVILKQAGNKAIQEITGGTMSQIKKTFKKRMSAS